MTPAVLDYVERRGESGAPWVVLLHGFAANAHDLAGLADEIDIHGQLNWVLPEGPVDLSRSLVGTSRAWFPRSREELESAFSGSYFDDLPERFPSGLVESADEVAQLIEGMNISTDRLIIGGFSQGSMVALWAALSLAQPPAGLLLFSSALVAQQRTGVLIAEAPPIPFLQSHGRADPILPYSGGQALYRLLQDAGFPGVLVAFGGGHQIPPDVVSAAREFIFQTVLPQAQTT